MNWYCIQTKPQKEAFASRYCGTILGLETYLPLLRRRKRSRGKKMTVLSPLFPRYIFCRLELSSHYRAVKYAPDVNEIVQSGGLPTVVGDELVCDLKTWAGSAISEESLRPAPCPGDAVIITSGVMNGLQAVFLHELDDRERVEVLLLVLNCGARMILDRTEVRRVS